MILVIHYVSIEGRHFFGKLAAVQGGVYMGWIGICCIICVVFFSAYFIGKFVLGFFTGENFMSPNEREIYRHNKSIIKQKKVNSFWYNYIWQYVIVGISVLVLLSGIFIKSIGVGFFGFMFLLTALFICAVGSSYRKNNRKIERDE